VERTLLSAAFDFDVVLNIPIKIKINVKGSGQECPLYRGDITEVLWRSSFASVPRGRARYNSLSECTSP